MSGPLKWILLLIVVSIRAQDPRRRGFWLCPNDYLQQPKVENDKLDCFDDKSITKRFDSGEIGPFWANRGKKDPLLLQDPLYAEEPYWMVLRSDNQFQEEPFFLSRGKKENEIYSSRLRETRDFVQDNDAPFFAARGKRLRVKN